MAQVQDLPDQPSLRRTPLHEVHRRHGARMVPFAGYEMPVQYPDGIIAEHNHTRRAAGLFDVSHMGQALLVGRDHDATAHALEALTPAELVALAPGQQRYTQLLGPDGGILDDLMVTRPADPQGGGTLMLVVNAARKEQDYAHLEAHLPRDVRLVRVEDRGLLALQGPRAESVLAHHLPDVSAMGFMTCLTARVAGVECHISRSGYTGEDGFEISVPAAETPAMFERLLGADGVAPVGLGARDTLRLEAGLPLYGHDIDETTSPVEAALAWSIGKRRRGEGGFLGASRILAELANGPSRLRVGIQPDGRAPVREGAEIRLPGGASIGRVTSGSFGPTANRPVAMGYVARAHAKAGTRLTVIVRGRELPASVAPLPFVPHRYRRLRGNA